MIRRGTFCLVGAVIGVAIVIGLAGRATRGTSDDFSFDAAKLKNTNEWTKVNAEPYRIGSVVDRLCAMPTANLYKAERRKNPHSASFITVYVNNTGREAMFAKEVQTFPKGSMIVKEKVANNSIEGNKPLLYTVMIKREPGYNPSVGDWEFAVVGANGKDLQGIGKLENCQSCHKQKPESDFVFRPYLKSN